MSQDNEKMKKWKVFANSSALLSAIIAVIAFVISVLDEVRERQTLAVDAWRKTAIHKVIQTSEKKISCRFRRYYQLLGTWRGKKIA